MTVLEFLSAVWQFDRLTRRNSTSFLDLSEIGTYIFSTSFLDLSIGTCIFLYGQYLVRGDVCVGVSGSILGVI